MWDILGSSRKARRSSARSSDQDHLQQIPPCKSQKVPSHLFSIDTRLKFYEFVRSQPFVRRLWRPPGFSAIGDIEDMEEEPIVHTLGNKTLADVVEAMIGAAFLTEGLFTKEGLDSALQMAAAIGIPLGGAK